MPSGVLDFTQYKFWFSPTPSYSVYTNEEIDPITFEVPNQVSYNGNGTAWMVKDVVPGLSLIHISEPTRPY